MLKISKMADYSSLIMNALAKQPEALCNAAAIAEVTDIALPTVSKLLKRLSSADLVVSVRGSAGGYRLARAVDKISLVELIMAIDGRPTLTECASGAKSCVQNDSCLVKHNWQLLNGFILKLLKSVTVADMRGSLRHHPLLQRLELAYDPK